MNNYQKRSGNSPSLGRSKSGEKNDSSNTTSYSAPVPDERTIERAQLSSLYGAVSRSKTSFCNDKTTLAVNLVQIDNNSPFVAAMLDSIRNDLSSIAISGDYDTVCASISNAMN